MFTLYAIAFLALFLIFGIPAFVLGCLYGFFRYAWPVINQRRRNPRDREAEPLAAQQAKQPCTKGPAALITIDYERL
jgi:hypothetical protein